MPNNNANIDERVVEMRIDNRQFVDGAEKTIGVLDKLKKALNFRGADEGLAELQSSANKLDLSAIASDVEQISSRFTTLGIIGQRVIQNLTDTITNFIQNTVRGFTIDPIMEGWSQYGEILEATRTIMAATRNEDYAALGYGSQIDYVNDQLERLMWYTDETSYSFQDMAANIGKFTNAGVPLEQAMVDMQGIANWAGLSGANVQEASRAMYNLSQAIATGSVKLMDWKSIENANMATLEFKQAVIETALEVGTLKKAGDGLYKTLDGNTVSAENFNAALSDGWFSAEVLERTLTKFGEFSRVLNETMSDLGFIGSEITTTDVLGWVKDIEEGNASLEDWHNYLLETIGDPNLVPTMEALEYAFKTITDDELELGRRAFEASQEYKTLKDALNATSDAVRTGWTKTFMTVIGDAEEAKAVWTYIGDELYDIFAEAGNRRNAILKIWRDLSTADGLTGRESLGKALENLYLGIRTYIDPIIEGFRRIFSWGDNNEAAQKLLELTERFEKFTEKIALSEKAQEGMANFFETVFGGAKKVLGIFKPVGSVIGTVLGYLRDFVELFFESFAGEDGFNSEEFMAAVSDLFGEIGDSAKEAWGSVKGFMSSIVGSESVRGALSKIYDKINEILESIFGVKTEVNKTTGFTEAMEAPLDRVRDFFSKIWEAVSGISLDAEGIRETFSKLGDIISTIYTGIVGDPEEFKNRIGLLVTKALEGIKEALSKIKLSDIFEGAKLGILGYIGLQFANFVTTFKKGADSLKSIPDSISGVFSSLSKTIDKYGQAQQATSMLKIAAAIAVLAVSIWALSKVPQDKFASVAVTLAFFAIVMGKIAKSLSSSSFFSNNSKGNSLKINVFSNLAMNLIALGIFIAAAAGAIIAIGKLNDNQLMRGLTTVGLLIAGITLAMVAINKSESDTKINIGALAKIIIFAATIKAAANAMSKLKDLSWSQIISAGFAMSIVMGALAGVLFVAKDATASGGLGSMLTMLSVILVMYTMVPLVVGVGKMLEHGGGPRLAASLLVLAAAAGIAVGLMWVMSKIGSSGGAIKGAAALAIVGAAFILFSAALALSVPPILALFAGLIGILELLNKATETMGVGKLWAAIGALAALSAIMVIAGVGASLLGAGMLMAGTGILEFSSGLLFGAIAIGILAAALVPFGEALIEFTNMLVENGETIILLVSVVLAGILTALIAKKLEISLTVVALILTVISVIHEYGPQILMVVGAILEDLLKFILTLIPMLIKFLVLAIIMVVDGTAESIRSNSDAIVSAIENLVSAIIELFLKVAIQLIGDAFGALWSLIGSIFGMSKEDVEGVAADIQSAANWLGDEAASRVNAAFGGLEREGSGGAQALIDGFHSEFVAGEDDISGALTEVLTGIYGDMEDLSSTRGSDSGSAAISSFVSGADSELLNQLPALDSLGDDLIGTFDISGATDVQGQNATVGFGNGLIKPELLQGVYDNGWTVGDTARRGISDSLGIQSPSKVAYALGGFFDLGLIKGIASGQGAVEDSSKNLGNRMVSAIQGAMTTIAALADEDFSISPVITPVVDMTNVEQSAGNISDILSTNANTANRVSQIGRSIANAESLAENMRNLSESRASVSQDTYEINIYPSPDMDEEAIADAVLDRLSSGIIRKGVALG